MLAIMLTLTSPVAAMRLDPKDQVRSKPPKRKPDWPLMGDILNARMDRPDLLVLWANRKDHD